MRNLFQIELLEMNNVKLVIMVFTFYLEEVQMTKKVDSREDTSKLEG